MDTDPKYLEPYYQYSFFYFNLALEKECRETLAILVKKLKEYEGKNDKELSEYNEEFLLPIVRMMVEGCMWEEALYLCDLAINCNKETPEGWYLYAFCSFESKLYQQAWDGIKK